MPERNLNELKIGTYNNPELDPRLALLHLILATLKQRGIRYSVIHGDTWDASIVTSDVDMCFAENPIHSLEPLLLNLADAGQLTIIQRLHYDTPHGYYYILKTPGTIASFLHLDCLCDPLGINRYYLTSDYLLEDRLLTPWGYRVASHRSILYLLIKRCRKRRISDNQHKELLKKLLIVTDIFWSDMEKWFGSSRRKLVENLQRVDDSKQLEREMDKLRRCLERRYRLRYPLRLLRRGFLNARRKITRLIRPTGYFLVIVGPDGAGKSTVAELLCRRLQSAFRFTWRFHWRPHLLPKLCRSRGTSDGNAIEGHCVMGRSKYRSLISLARFGYYWADFVLGYWLLIFPRRSQTTLVIGERYFPDVLVHPERYGFATPRWLMRLAASLVPSPDLVVLLKDRPENIFARKPELPVSLIASQITAFERELSYWGNSTVISTDEGAEVVAAKMGDLVLEHCARRTSERTRWHEKRRVWRGFPSTINPKLWVEQSDSVANALNLYHPYSTSGRLAKYMLRILPNDIARWACRGIPERSEHRRLTRLANTIRVVLNDPELKISFFTGTAGPYRKLTAQASKNQFPVAYVKIGYGDVVVEMLQQESRTLNSLRSVTFTKSSVPHVLGVARSGEDFLLLLDAPNLPGRRRPIEPDAADATFLSELCAEYLATARLEDVLQTTGLEQYIEQAYASNLPAAQILRDAMESVRRTFADGVVHVTLYHGDYAPWNTLDIDRGRLHVFDWEYSRDGFPVLADFLHRIFLPGRLVENRTAAVLVARALGLWNDSAGRMVMRSARVSEAQLPAYVLLYLAIEMMRKADAEGNVDGYLQECMRHVLVAAGHPSHRRRILVSAYACEPGSGSEPGVGWQMCNAISRNCDAWVITRENNRAVIERQLTRHPNPNLHFTYVDLPRWVRLWKKGNRGIRTYYYIWQFAAWNRARKMHAVVKFDAGHHVTFVNDWLFTFLALLPIPFVWGPIGSHPMAPGELTAGPLSMLQDRARYGFQFLMRTADPLFWMTLVRARLVVGISTEVGERFPLSLLARRKFVQHCAIGVDDVSGKRSNSGATGVRVLSMGRLVPVKAFHLGIHGFARLCAQEKAARLTIVGKGTEQGDLRKLVRRLGIEDNVEFLDWMPREQALQKMCEADIFLFPSFEGGGMVVLEAMAHALPVVCLKFGGPGDMVTADCGCPVEVGGFEHTVEGLGRALTKLAADHQLRERMGNIAMERVRRMHLWEDRHKILAKWYGAMQHF